MTFFNLEKSWVRQYFVEHQADLGEHETITYVPSSKATNIAR